MKVKFGPEGHEIVVVLDIGGSMHKISVNGKIYHFEMHPYCGPNILNKRTGSSVKNQPDAFLVAASLWAQQGKRIDSDGICIWMREPEEILRHLGNHYEIIGYTESARGE